MYQVESSEDENGNDKYLPLDPSIDDMCDNLEDDVTPLAQTKDFDNEYDDSFALAKTKPFDLTNGHHQNLPLKISSLHNAGSTMPALASPLY